MLCILLFISSSAAAAESLKHGIGKETQEYCSVYPKKTVNSVLAMGIKSILVIGWQRFCEPTRLRIAYCPSEFCDLWTPLPDKLSAEDRSYAFMHFT